jgi:hypothetical protein
VYVRLFPDVSKAKSQVSTSGGDNPLWSPDGRELFYRNGDSVMSVSVKTDPAFSLEKPKTLFRGTYVSVDPAGLGNAVEQWDISRDGKIFLMMKPPQAASGASTAEAPNTTAPQPKITIVVNWFEELKQRVPIK